MEGERTPCVICAWRGTCNKKFSMSSSSTIRCPEYTRDVTLVEKKEKKTWEQEAIEIIDAWANEHATGKRCPEGNMFTIYAAGRTCVALAREALKRGVTLPKEE